MRYDPEDVPFLESYTAELRPRRSRPRAPSRAATERRHAAIEALLRAGLSFTVRAIGEALGISRQLALYHVKRMAAAGRVVLVLEPCPRNGGLQYRVWTEAGLMAHYVVKARATLGATGRRAA